MDKIVIDFDEASKIMREDNIKNLTRIIKEMEDSLKNNSYPRFLKKEDIEDLISKSKRDLDKLNGTNTSNS